MKEDESIAIQTGGEIIADKLDEPVWSKSSKTPDICILIAVTVTDRRYQLSRVDSDMNF